MKRVTSWFKAASFCATAWLVLSGIELALKLFMSSESYDNNLICLLLSLATILLLFAVKLCMGLSVIFLVQHFVDEYEKEEKTKFDFEKEKTP